MTTITHEQVTRTLDEVVAESPDFIYKEPETVMYEGCKYEVIGSDGCEYRCLIGEILFRLLPEHEFAVIKDDETYNGEAIDRVEMACDFLEFEEYDDVRSLGVAQFTQDAGEPWRMAREHYYDAYSRFSGEPNPLTG